MSATRINVVVNPDVAWAFRSLAYPPDHCFIFCPYTKDGQELLPLSSNGAVNGVEGKVTAVTQSKIDDPEFAVKLRENNQVRLYHGESHHFQTHTKFHYGFCIPPFIYERDTEAERINVYPQLVNDVLSVYKCSKDSRSEDRIGPMHMICLESMYNAVLPAGIFAAVMPKGWMGRNMRYINWLQTEFAVMARIELPENAVYEKISEDQVEPIHIKHELVMFCKAINGSAESKIAHLFPFARFRYQPFIHKMEGFDDLDLHNLGRAFSENDWQQYYVMLLRKKYLENSGHYNMRLSPSLPPISLDDPSNTILFTPSDQAKRKIRIMDSIEDIKQIKTAVHIKVGSRVKFHTYHPLAESLVLELRVYLGRNYAEDRSSKWLLDEALSYKMFHAERDWIAETLINAGLTPCLLKSDADRLACREKWAERQLTPIERTVRQDTGWLTQFEEIGLRSSYPAEIDQWRKRMAKMKMNKILFTFQAEDVLVLASKNGVMNCNVMGLGKTIEILMAFLLRGNKKCLIVAPSKLLGEWRNEIESRLAAYCATARTNWKGENIRHSCEFQIIQWAEDCLKQNLKPINLISYEHLVRAPRDTRYFYCKRCGSTAASMKFAEKMACPKCNENLRNKWTALCREKQFKKYWVKNEHVEKLEAGKISKDTFRTRCFYLGGIKKFSAKYEQLHNSGYICFDERPPMPEPVWMKRSKNLLVKKQGVTIGLEDKYVPVNGELKKISVPVTEMRPRRPHLKWTFANLLRHRFNFIGLDEADYIKNDKSQRSEATLHLKAKTRIAATGTPVRGFPKSIINLINWTVARTVFPEYRIRADRGALGRFYAKYKTEVTNLNTGRKKILPKILNPEQFQTEVAPFMLRHTRNEPAVLDCISKKIIEGPTREKIDMDESHRQYYQLWIEKFSEWWQKMKEEEEHKKVPSGQILVKLTYLINASTQPHFMLDNILKGKDEQAKEWAIQIGRYRGPMTAKHLECFRRVKEIYRMGDKAIVFSIRRNNLKLGMKWCNRQNPRIEALQIDGRVSRTIKNGGRSERERLLENFKLNDYSVLWAGLQCMRDGANLPEANHGLFMDLSWEPSDYRQAAGRMVRPSQEKTIYLTHLIHNGTLDDFVSLWTILKARSVDEGIDYMEFDDFSTDMIPDVQQYANDIVDGTEARTKARMELAIEHIRKQKEEGLTDEGI